MNSVLSTFIVELLKIENPKSVICITVTLTVNIHVLNIKYMGKYWFIIYKIWYTKNLKFTMSTFFNSLIVFYYSHVLIVHLLFTIVATLNFYGPNCMYRLSELYIQSESKNRNYNSWNRTSLEFFHWNIKLIAMS